MTDLAPLPPADADEKAPPDFEIATSLYELDGRALLRNAAATRAYGEPLGDPAEFARCFVDAAVGDRLRRLAIEAGRHEGEALAATTSGPRWRRLDLHCASSPAHGRRLLLVAEWERSMRRAERAPAHAELTRAKEAAEAANRAKDVFLANISHEIRTPLNAIIGAAELLNGAALDARQTALLDVAHDAARALIGIVDEVLDLAKLQAGTAVLEKVPTSPRRCVEAVVAMFRAEAELKGLRLTSSIDEQAPELVLGDPVRLRQVLTNLVANAVKFTHGGEIGVRLLCRSLASQVELRFEVEDTGIGVPEAQRAAIFDRFAQADGASTRRYDGAGLGLAVSRQLCEAMGGAIGVGSGARGGSVFWFTVPMLRAAAPGERSEPAAPIPSPRLRILLVEDNEPNQVVAGAMIERLGHDYRCAPDGPTAVQAAQADDYDLILMDVQMPGMDGMTATRAIRALAGPRGRTPVVAFSAATDSRRQDEYLAAGMNGMLAKPVKLKELALLFERFAATPASAISAGEPQPESGGRGAAAESEVQALLAAIETAA